MSNRFMTAFGVLALSAGAALAQAPANPPSNDPSPKDMPAAAPAKPATKDVPAGATAAGNVKEHQAAVAAKTDLAKALMTAESKDGQGRAIDADFEQVSGSEPAQWQIKVVYPDGKLVEHFIDADTGAVIKSENQPFERYFTRLKVSDFQNAKTPLKDALAVAEKKAGGGKAYEAEVEREGESVVYEISVALPDRSQEVKVGPDGMVVGD